MRMPAYMFLATNGKHVLRPGGERLTKRLIEATAIQSVDDVVELGPGPGATMRRILAQAPHSYTAVERDRRAAAAIRRRLGAAPSRRCVAASAEAAELPHGSASVVVSEAILTMQRPVRKREIVSEVARLLRPGGRWMIHELALVPDTIDQETEDALCADLAHTMHVGARPLTAAAWKRLLHEHGFTVEHELYEPLGLLEPARLLRDERLRAARFALTLLRAGQTRRRVRSMRRLFQDHSRHLSAIGLVVVRQP